MSQRSAGAGGKSGITRSSSSSSSSSSSTSSSSSSSHNRRGERSRSRSRSRISSSSSHSRSPSRTRSRSGDRHNKRRRNRDDRRDSRIGSRSNQELDHDDSSSDHLIDDSIRSDKSSKSSSNGGYGGTASSQRDSIRATPATAAVAATAAVKTTSSIATGTKASAQSMEQDPIAHAPPPPRISKTAIQFGKPGTVARPGIHMKLAQTKAQPEPPKKITVASAFNNDSDDEVEEMPPECKMRMRNIGRDTPTSSGPNSFGKTKQGFIDSKKLFEKSLREAAME